MRIIFFGSPDDAVHLLGSLIKAGHEIAAVYTQPDRRVGRGRIKQATAVKIFSEQQGLDTFTPVSLRDDEVEFERMLNIAADVFVVAATVVCCQQKFLEFHYWVLLMFIRLCCLYIEVLARWLPPFLMGNHKLGFH